MPMSIDAATLQSLLLGKLPPDEADRLIDQLDAQNSDSLAALAGGFADGKDTLIEALKSQSTASDVKQDPRIARLMDRLARLWEAEDSPTAAASDGTVFVQGRASHPEMSFLSPPQSGAEIVRLTISFAQRISRNFRCTCRDR